MILGRRKADLFSQGSHKWTFIGGAAMSKKHVFGHEAAENLSALRTDISRKHDRTSTCKGWWR